MIDQPNYTQCPNQFFDDMLKTLSGAESKVFCVIMRKTFGWQKKRDRVSYTQIMEMSGISSTATVSAAIKELEAKGYIVVEKIKQASYYSVNVSENEAVQKLNQFNNQSGTTSKSEAVAPKTTSKSEHTKERDINKLSKETYEEIETAYFEAFKAVIPSGEPILDYGAIRKRQKAVLAKTSKEKIIAAINAAKRDEWIIDNGFSLMTILGDFQLNKLLNGNPTPKRGTNGDVAKYKQNPGGMPDHPYTPTFGKH